MKDTNYIIESFSNEFTEKVNQHLIGEDVTVMYADIGTAKLCSDSGLKNVRAIFVSSKQEAHIYNTILRLTESDPYIFVVSETETDEGTENNTAILSGREDPKQIAAMLMRLIEIQEYNRRKELEKRLENHVADLLMSGDITPEYLGFHYIKEAILIYINTEIRDYNLKDKVYQQIAETHMTTTVSIERSIRCSIIRSWENSPFEFRQKYFGTLGIKKIKVPSPKEYIMTIAEKVKRDLKNGEI
ncbi:MAG: hypothetical protein IKP95_10625 [Ruminococcus sp.]|nr:hypothetical protein [Ruminococcus sp.]